MGEIAESEVERKLRSRIMVYIGERDAYEFGAKLSVTEAIKRSGMSRDSAFLRSIGIHSADLLSSNALLGLAHQYFQLFLLSFSIQTMESSEMRVYNCFLGFWRGI